MANNKDNEFTKTLRYYGISKRQLGDEMNLSQPTVKDYCANPQKFRLNQLRKIGQMTDMTLNEIDNIIESKNEENA
tara:strand:- start:1641 stop:1868 length:228 start_codon:yes stop_codon:yes gene_type:complete